MTAAEVGFWAAVAVVGYTYLGYPAIMCGLARLFPRPIRTAPIAPPLTVLVAAHNEERRIAAKIENCLALDYPPERLETLVVSDGSTDRTAAVAGEYAARFPGRVRVVSIPIRQGKAHALNTGAALASGEILLLADVRQRLERTAARALVRNFADAEVGAVSGELILVEDDLAESAQGLGLYWRYEKTLRQAEGRFRSSICYTGAISAIRRSLFKPLPEETLHDDFVMPLGVAAAGYRVVFEPGARAVDRVSKTARQEFPRKMRTLAGALQTLVHVRRFVGPLTARVWWQFLSHTVLRLLVPYALLTALLTSALVDGPVYRAAFTAQAVAYALGVAGLLAGASRASGGWARTLSVPSTFLVLNTAAIVGPLCYLAGWRLGLWRRTPSEPVTDAPMEPAGDPRP